MFKEKLTITKEDTTLAKLTKFCAWIGIIFCFLIFSIIWIIFFIILGGPTILYKMFSVIHKHNFNKKQHRIARKEIIDNEIF